MMRMIHQTNTINDKFVRVYGKNEHNEYVVKFYGAGGKHMDDSDYFTDNLDDAICTAQYYIFEELKHLEAEKWLSAAHTLAS